MKADGLTFIFVGSIGYSIHILVSGDIFGFVGLGIALVGLTVNYYRLNKSKETKEGI